MSVVVMWKCRDVAGKLLGSCVEINWLLRGNCSEVARKFQRMLVGCLTGRPTGCCVGIAWQFAGYSADMNALTK